MERWPSPVEGDGLENRYGSLAHREFKSLPLRHALLSPEVRPSESFGLLRAEHDPARIEVLGVGFVCRAAEHVDHAAHPQITEAGGSNKIRVLPDEECSGDSTRPEVDISNRILRKGFLHHDISNLQSPARLEHTMDFPEDGFLVRAQVDHAI